MKGRQEVEDRCGREEDDEEKCERKDVDGSSLPSTVSSGRERMKRDIVAER